LTGNLLLDTCALIWIVEDNPLAEKATFALNEANKKGDVNFISPITAWEIGMLTSRGRLALSLAPQLWFEQILRNPEVRLSDMPPSVLIDSSHLPGEPPNDPADRIIIATARAYNLSIVTRDQAILAYAAYGHVNSIEC